MSAVHVPTNRIVDNPLFTLLGAIEMHASQGYSDQPSGRNAVAVEKPRITSQLEQLAKVLSSCHEVASNVERAADRILGPTPQDASKRETAPPSDTIERKLHEAISYAEGLYERLQATANRLNSAV